MSELLSDKEWLQNRGIHLNEFDVIGNIAEARKLIAEKSEQMRGMAHDAYTDPSAGVPPSALWFFEQKVVQQIIQPLAFFQIAEPWQYGQFETKTIWFPLAEVTGKTVPYGSYSRQGQSNYRVNWPQRDIYLYSDTVQYEDLEVATMGAAKIDAITMKRFAMATTMSLDANTFGFFGVSGVRNYGLLNDPDLNAIIPATLKASGNTKWVDATAKEIIADLLLMVASLSARSAGRINAASSFILALPPAQSVYLDRPSDFINYSVMQYIKGTFPSLKIVTAPQYITGSSDGDKCQLIANNPSEWGGNYPPVLDLFNYKYRSHGVVRELNWYDEKVSAGTGGAGIIYPMSIATMEGI